MNIHLKTKKTIKQWRRKYKKTYKTLKISLMVFVILAVLVMVGDGYFSAAVYSKGDIKMAKIVKSAQYKQGIFRNTKPWEFPSFGQSVSTMWKFMFSGNERSPKQELPVQPVNLQHFNSSARTGLKATWLGHSSIMLNLDGYKILVDPVFEKSVSIAGPTRFNGDVPLDLSQLPDIDVVIITHNHYDHLNKFSIQFLAPRTNLFITPLVVGAQLEKWGVDREKIVELDWWEEHQITSARTPGLMIAATPAQHFSGRGLSDRNKTLWASFVIIGPQHKVFCSGDSGYFKGFKKIGETYGPFDMTFMECGAYDKRWYHIHMLPEETVQAHLDVKGKLLHPIHWGTFNLALHAWYEPMQRLTAAAAAAKVQTATPVVGDTTVYGQYVPEQKWWRMLSKKNNQDKNKTLILEGVNNETN